MTSRVCSHTDEEMSACASGNYFTHSVTAGQITVCIAIFSQNSLICSFFASAVPSIVSPLKVAISINIPVLGDSIDSGIG